MKNNWFLLSLGTLILWGWWAFLPKLALQTLSPDSVLFYEAIGNILVTVPVWLCLKEKLERDRSGIIFTAWTSAVNMVGILAYLYALRLGPVAIIVTVTAMYPIITLALARIFLKEKASPLQFLAIGMALAAIALLTS